MKVGILGSGEVAQALGDGFIKHRHEVMLGTRDPAKLADWAAKNPAAHVGSFTEAAQFGELIVLAVNGKASAAALGLAGAENLAGKTIIDATNPITDAPPVNGVLSFFTKQNESLLEQLQQKFADACFVKAFNSVGSDLMVNPRLEGGRPTMFICGNDAAAKKAVTEILDQFGWETLDMGAAEAARPIEALSILWCIPGFLRNEWTHAFKLLR
jgi:predicted dinucleotide-binding enzyme